MYLKSQITKFLENCFPNKNCFSWTKLIPVLIHLKYLFYSYTYSFPASLAILVKFYPSQLKPPLNSVLIIFFIGLLILSYPIQPYVTARIKYTKPYPNSSQPNLISSYIQIIMPYRSNKLPIRKLSLKKPLVFQS